MLVLSILAKSLFNTASLRCIEILLCLWLIRFRTHAVLLARSIFFRVFFACISFKAVQSIKSRFSLILFIFQWNNCLSTEPKNPWVSLRKSKPVEHIQKERKKKKEYDVSIASNALPYSILFYLTIKWNQEKGDRI